MYLRAAAHTVPILILPTHQDFVTCGTAAQNLRVLSVLRLALPEADLPATTALASLSPGGQAEGLRAGANVLMPSFTPEARRADYRIYDHKAPVSLADAASAIAEAGRTAHMLDPVRGGA